MIAAAPALLACAELLLAAPFGDGMVLQRDAPIEVWGTAEPDEALTLVLGARIASGTADVLGRFRLVLEPLPASAEPRELLLHGRRSTVRVADVRIGDVWLCAGDGGQPVPAGPVRPPSASAEPAAAPVRVLDLAPGAPPDPGAFDAAELAACRPSRTPAGEWTPLERAAIPEEIAAFAAGLAEAGVPIGLVRAEVPGSPIESWVARERLSGALDLHAGVGAWIDDPRLPAACRARAAENLAGWMDAVLAASERGELPPETPGHPYQPGFLRAAALEPLFGLRFTGALWRQGRVHVRDPGLIEPLTAAVLAELRARLDARRVVLAQLGGAPGAGEGAALVREAQRRIAESDRDTVLAVTLGARDARELGRRLARAASAPAGSAGGPLAVALLSGDGRILVRFDGVGDGLRARGGALASFEVAGPDGAFVPAAAEIVGADLVRVHAPAVPDPRRVRYAWGEDPAGDLEASDGRPASPFELGG